MSPLIRSEKFLTWFAPGLVGVLLLLAYALGCLLGAWLRGRLA